MVGPGDWENLRGAGDAQRGIINKEVVNTGMHMVGGGIKCILLIPGVENPPRVKKSILSSEVTEEF